MISLIQQNSYLIFFLHNKIRSENLAVQTETFLLANTMRELSSSLCDFFQCQVDSFDASTNTNNTSTSYLNKKTKRKNLLKSDKSKGSKAIFLIKKIYDKIAETKREKSIKFTTEEADSEECQEMEESGKC